VGIPTSEVGYTSTTIGRGDHKVHKGHVVALEKKKFDLPKFLHLPIILLLERNGEGADVLNTAVRKRKTGWRGGC
jgi:hypothetical protein